MPAPAEIVQLVELFQRNYDQYRDPAFSEAAVRHDPTPASMTPTSAQGIAASPDLLRYPLAKTA